MDASLKWIDAEAFAQSYRRFTLTDPCDKGRERNEISAPVTAGEIAPFTRSQIDLEASRSVVRPHRVAGDPLSTFSASVWKKGRDNLISPREGRLCDPLEGNPPRSLRGAQRPAPALCFDALAARA